MRAVPLTEELVPAFLHYCQTYGREHDESFLPEGEFSISEDHPTYLLFDGEELVGVGSLILTESFRQARKARVRILHSIRGDLNSYQQLLSAFTPHLREIDSIYLFVPEAKEAVQHILVECQFTVERYVYVLECKGEKIVRPSFPDGYELRPMVAGQEGIWCEVRNRNFAKLTGNVPCTIEKVEEIQRESGYISGGMQILWKGEKPVGTVSVIRDLESEEPTADIGTLSVDEEEQGKGLGRNLLRAGVHFGMGHGLKNSALCVNADNPHAAQLYLDEGFEKTYTMVCYTRRCEH